MTEPPQPSAPPPQTGAPRPAYKGEELDAARGPGLGCFWVQVVLLVAFVVLTPLSAFAGWPPLVTLGLMLATLVLLLFVGQTVIFLLRIVAAERGQRRPRAARTRTVGEIETATGEAPPAGEDAAAGPHDDLGANSPGMRE